MLYMNIKLVKPKIHSAVLQYILPLLFLFLFAIGAKAQSRICCKANRTKVR